MSAMNPAFEPSWGMRGGHRGGHGKGCGAHRHDHLHAAIRFFAAPGGPREFGGGPFGPLFGGHRGGPYGRHGGPKRARRGDVRLAALLLLAEEPRNGYSIMQELERRSEGVWRPSPGSVYPALAQLEDEGLIRSSESEGGRAFEITDAGRAHLAERPQDATAPWEAVGQGVAKESLALFQQARQLAAAVMQVAQAGSPAQSEQAKQILDDARRAIYRILADGDEQQ